MDPMDEYKNPGDPEAIQQNPADQQRETGLLLTKLTNFLTK